MTSYKKILPGQYLGMIGGGQLGRMFCMAAQSMGYKVMVLDPAPSGPARDVANDYICADYTDEQALLRLAQQCQAVSIEFENVPAQTLEFLAKHTQVSPSASPVSISQDRMLEKQFFSSIGVATAPYIAIHTTDDILGLSSDIFPAILKTARLGYDGKGQVHVDTIEEVQQAFASFKGVPCVLEAKLDIHYEVSVVVARGFDGDLVHYPIAENEHHHGILALSTIPSRRLPHHLSDQAVSTARKVAVGLDYYGVLCVEFFVLKDGSLVANEMAPRPHNSGHYSIDACVSSQFEQQVRVMAGMPLGCAMLLSPAKMLNILGDSWFINGQTSAEPDWNSILKVDNACLHLYGKSDARIGRKMGHVTLLDPDTRVLDAATKQVAHMLHIKL